jgi:hypothetical protein
MQFLNERGDMTWGRQKRSPKKGSPLSFLWKRGVLDAWGENPPDWICGQGGSLMVDH